MEETYSCGLGEIPKELEALQIESENCFGYAPANDPTNIGVFQIEERITLDQLVCNKEFRLSSYHPLCCWIKVRK